eukprot:CAMPEP_0119333572 /NCGR_PEP_ID=MMETSP1333-20130426/85441_1 /TAXON_ID=418940 /ORGANISM="Scyphosphaera apsteinii, Strain RCC1455" /LENGTH=369 /DNA_ID=CAMNT_0007343669 /DNA_START=100 /DNA_END=1209 /DNA_ORIENTATION=-
MPGCQWTVDGACASMGNTVAVNATILAGLALAATKKISLKGLLLGKYLKVFTGAAIRALEGLAANADTGKAFDFDVTTPNAVVISAIRTRRIEAEDAVGRVAELMDTHAASADNISKLKLLLTLIKTSKKVESFDGSGEHPVGRITFIFGTITNWVKSEGIISRVSMAVGEGGTRSMFSTVIVRFDEWAHVAESLNLFVMYAYVFGLGAPTTITGFIQSAFYDTMRYHSYPFQVAFEVVINLMVKVEELAGSLQLATVCDVVHLNSVYAEAITSAIFFFPKLEAVLRKGSAGVVKCEYNGKFTKGAERVCPAYNLNIAHNPSLLKQDGTCMCDHICNKWVSNKGPGGKCGGAHRRVDCDNPFKVEEEQK